MITLGRLLLGFGFDSNQYASMAVQDLTKGGVGSQLTRMTIPFFLGISSMILGSMIETIYVGMLGAKELAARPTKSGGLLEHLSVPPMTCEPSLHSHVELPSAGP